MSTSALQSLCVKYGTWDNRDPTWPAKLRPNAFLLSILRGSADCDGNAAINRHSNFLVGKNSQFTGMHVDPSGVGLSVRNEKNIYEFCLFIKTIFGVTSPARGPTICKRKMFEKRET